MAWWRPPPPNGYCCGRYASYWNAFFFWWENKTYWKPLYYFRMEALLGSFLALSLAAVLILFSVSLHPFWTRTTRPKTWVPKIITLWKFFQNLIGKNRNKITVNSRKSLSWCIGYTLFKKPLRTGDWWLELCSSSASSEENWMFDLTLFQKRSSVLKTFFPAAVADYILWMALSLALGVQQYFIYNIFPQVSWPSFPFYSFEIKAW